MELPCSSDGVLEIQLLLALESFMKKSIVVPKYIILIYLFEEKYKQTIDLRYFLMLEDMFCIWKIDQSMEIKCVPLNANSITAIFYQGTLDIISILKSIKGRNVLPSFRFMKPNNPLFMYVKLFEKLVVIKYDNTSHAFILEEPKIQTITDLISEMQKNIFTLRQQDINQLFKYSKYKYVLEKPVMLSEKLADYLFELTNGNYQTLINLAILFCNISSSELLTPKLFLVTYSMEELSISISQYISMLINFSLGSDSEILCEYTSISKIIQKQQIPMLIETYFDSKKAFIILKGSTTLSESQIKSFKQFLKGGRMKGRDLKLGNISYKNTKPVICFSNDHKEITFLENNFQCLKINLDAIKDFQSLKIPIPDKDERDLEWLRINFSLFGLYILKEEKSESSLLSNKKKLHINLTSDLIINEFLSDCCDYSSKSFVYADELYEVYLEYYKYIHKSKPLKRTQMIAIIKNNGSVKYKRPHASRNLPNKYAFVGLVLKENWKEFVYSYLEKPSDEEVVFKERLREIDSIVPQLLYK